MANARRRLAINAPGALFVDHTCIDCDTCRQIAPAVFARSAGDERSFVARQPDHPTAQLSAGKALVACPTSSIGSEEKLDLTAAVRAFPEHIANGVHYCGYASPDSFGASSYLIVRPAGNVLVDSPRAATPLLSRIAELGGVRTMFLTHRDDVADHARMHARFACERVIHEADVTRDTAEVERKLAGSEPVALDEELLAIPVPGHTRGSMVLLYRERFLFTGDHLWGSEDEPALEASRSVAWYSWAEQKRSLEKLLSYRFEWVLPGHGRRFGPLPAAAMRSALEHLVLRVRGG